VDKIGEKPLTIKDFPKDQDCILLIDDLFDAYSEQSPMRKTMADLVRAVLVKGRHHKARANQLGLSICVIFHHPHQGRASNSWHRELKDLVVFPKSNRASTVEWMRIKYSMKKSFLERLFTTATGRVVHFHLFNPMYVVAENLVELI
jgi:hypothetical protein